MPLINGQKMACEPCIRGHRSTKCTHANERLMVPVRKPGRPLSTCPHPVSRPCSCGQVTAAIPRKQKCHCGPNSAEPPEVKAEASDLSNATPQSPPKATNPPYRIQKTTTKNGTQPLGRRQSVDTTALERMDPNMLNIMPAYSTAQQKPPAPMPDMSAFGAMGMVPADTSFGPMVYPVFSPQMPSPMIGPDAANGMPNGHSPVLTNGQASDKDNETTSKVGSCCGGGSNGVTTSLPATTQSSTTVSSPIITSERKTKSCCSSGINSPKAEPKSDVLPMPGVSAPNGLVMPPFQPPMVIPNGIYPYYPQPTIFTYPPQYGSFLQPLQPEQWRQVMASMTFAAQGGMPAPYAIPNAVPYHAQGTPHSAAGTSHQCTCGETCQCVGCAAHPYNDATQSYVRSAWESMMDDPQNPRANGHGDHGHTHVNGHGSSETAIQNDSPNPDAMPVVGSVEGTRSPTAPETPSEAASGMSEEQALSASDFFFALTNPAYTMDHGHSSRRRSPRRDHGSREWSDERTQDRDTRPRDSRSRSRSPKRAKTSSSRRNRPSEKSGHHHISSKHRSSHRHREHATRTADARVSVDLPFSARPLSKVDLQTFEAVFADYLSLQKQKEIEDMDEREVRGRWKSFIGKWNRGELAKGWYDPERFAQLKADPERSQRTYRKSKDETKYDKDEDEEERKNGSDGDEDEEEDYGPILPTADSNRRAGPGIPTLQDLSLRTELNEEDREASIAALRDARKADRALQKERLDDLVPRAEAGTRERKIEKRQLVNEKMRSFREKSPGMEVGNEQEVMGGGDTLAEFKRAKENEQRRKTEREIRREEADRAKREEMEERRKAWKEREEGTVGMLRELARQRFG
ncbi:hypothetical protein AK830_g9183 [Neonectria ditissima]|uniref:Copper-fist domain-containing protein n=1 Tax=Neonectria ditissima TaxID=78410 RepID=A0A0P7BCV4_9HYPO|nr:hypothetical protein AK830_g9183 [Neonectria ditissima]